MVSNLIKFGIPVLALVIWASVFTVDERQKAILFKFGEILRSDFEPGLHSLNGVLMTSSSISRPRKVTRPRLAGFFTRTLTTVCVMSLVSARYRK